MSFTRKRGRPPLVKPDRDKGTPELQQKRSVGLTFEVADRFLQLGIFSEGQHHAARRLAWLFRLRHGKSRLTAVALEDAEFHVHEEDEMWNAKREKEYIAAIASIKSTNQRQAVFDACIYDAAPSRPEQVACLRDGLDELVKFWRYDR